MFAVIVRGVYPTQCVVVWDRKESAQSLSDHLNAKVAPETEIQEVDSFFPPNMCNADAVWIRAAESYLRGDHINTSGEKES